MTILFNALKKNLYLLLLPLLYYACSDSVELKGPTEKLFQRRSSIQTGILLNNALNETAELNYFNFKYIYMGGGVSVADFNSDGLVDIYFTGNMVNNQLYLNQGALKFDDVTAVSATALPNTWCTGTTTVDINNDGLMDIYVSVAGKYEPYTNRLLVNQGNDEKGVPIFKEHAEKYGLADEGRTEQSVFFDYDNDGDLDLYVINYPITDFKIPAYYYQAMMRNADISSSSHLYRNNGDLTFTDVTEPSGLLSFGLSIGVSIADLNNDGFKDIYVSNDFASPDFIYMNNGNGTFSNKANQVTNQTSFYGMGTDIADFNNDGLMDIIQLDMSPASHKRSKENMASMDPQNFKNIVDLGLHHQYMYNTLQLNRGISKSGLPIFSNIAAFSGVKSTDWSWAALFADFDNDGLKDLYISNGTRRDIHNKDYFNALKKDAYFKSQQNDTKSFRVIEKMPSKPLKNFMFHNNGDLTFSEVSEDWGLEEKTFSNGTAYADFDNDGDLDLVVNNIDAKASFYENKVNKNNYLKVKFNGNKKNKLGIGSIVRIYSNEKLQIRELTLTRGYQSSVEPILYFGLGNTTNIDSLVVTWFDGATQKIQGVSTNITITLAHEDATVRKSNSSEEQPIFTNITKQSGIEYVHQENDYNDYQFEPLLPHKMSQFGPGVAVADVNGDHLEDFWIGGATKQNGAIYFQTVMGKFVKANVNAIDSDKDYEDLDGLFFDVDGDGDQDLYVVSGGNEFPVKDKLYEDRLYINDGKGNFSRSIAALPQRYESGSKVIPIDYDGDGDLDLFVTCRLIPRRYPMPATSYLLENVSDSNGVKFKEIIGIATQSFNSLGLVTDAVAIDFDNDGDQDLVVVGEWMPITFLENDKQTFRNITQSSGVESKIGWWYSIETSDMDKDGDLDIVVGNLGLNYKYKASSEKTFDIYANDFDNNGKLDIVLGFYEGKVQYPVRGRQCSSQQVPEIKNKFKNYEKFAAANLAEIYTVEKLEGGLHYKAETFGSVYIENQGNGKFIPRPLPNEAQFSSINTILLDDFDADGKQDILAAGNLFVSEAETPRNDASIGILMAQRKSGFESIPMSTSGFLAKNDVKNMKIILVKGQKCVLIANNNDAMQLFSIGIEKKH